ncbi:MAG: L-histidine N(alpha)-methyltransferase [Bacteroidales bacterium]|jgi:dimethylhistidine N-methyltransferase|nr:L-histidine N(alpha)-methyltransferase [Bacteroidales bacterium]
MEQQTLISELATDTLRGLTAGHKFLLSKYFYDDAGSLIFQDIMQMPEYYLTDCELEIFETYKKQITASFHQGVHGFDLIELGSGDGLKTKILLHALVENNIHFNYIPIDISHKANMGLVKSLKTEFPLMNVNARTGDYFHEIKKLNGYSGLRKVFLFLGSNIGNFPDEEISLFLGQLSGMCHSGDKILIGFDLKKSPQVIMQAYSDPNGYTRRFNLNHLVRLNRELDADFIPDNFEHQTVYNPVSGTVKSFLVSKTEQSVYLAALETTIHFDRWEPIYMELSRKFDQRAIETMASEHGFQIEHQFTDRRNYFVNSLWVKK